MSGALVRNTIGQCYCLYDKKKQIILIQEHKERLGSEYTIKIKGKLVVLNEMCN